MSDPITSTPTSPPAAPIIPIGLGTQVGLAAAAAQFVACLVTVFLDGDHSQETILTLITATVTLVTVLTGRFAQAYAALRDAPSPRQGQAQAQNFYIPGPINPSPPPAFARAVDDEIGGDPLAGDSDLVPEDRMPDPDTIPLDVGDGQAGAER